jgi:hypothetical protein
MPARSSLVTLKAKPPITPKPDQYIQTGVLPMPVTPLRNGANGAVTVLCCRKIAVASPLMRAPSGSDDRYARNDSPSGHGLVSTGIQFLEPQSRALRGEFNYPRVFFVVSETVRLGVRSTFAIRRRWGRLRRMADGYLRGIYPTRR